MILSAFGSVTEKRTTDELEAFVGIWSSVYVVYGALCLWSLNWLSVISEYGGGNGGETTETALLLSAASFIEAALLAGARSRTAACLSVGFHAFALAVALLFLAGWSTIAVRDLSDGKSPDMVFGFWTVTTVFLFGYLFERSFKVAKACSIIWRRNAADAMAPVP